mmetsp:Transcript_88361/g.286078  ORF Transcript_88361/g.286078 Transcript_88361/m.286078 type:complete len:372 (+) Transcript_88361:444-1559(+)
MEPLAASAAASSRGSSGEAARPPSKDGTAALCSATSAALRPTPARSRLRRGSRSMSPMALKREPSRPRSSRCPGSPSAGISMTHLATPRCAQAAAAAAVARQAIIAGVPRMCARPPPMQGPQAQPMVVPYMTVAMRQPALSAGAWSIVVCMMGTTMSALATAPTTRATSAASKDAETARRRQAQDWRTRPAAERRRPRCKPALSSNASDAAVVAATTGRAKYRRCAPRPRLSPGSSGTATAAAMLSIATAEAVTRVSTALCAEADQGFASTDPFVGSCRQARADNSTTAQARRAAEAAAPRPRPKGSESSDTGAGAAFSLCAGAKPAEAPASTWRGSGRRRLLAGRPAAALCRTAGSTTLSAETTRPVLVA